MKRFFLYFSIITSSLFSGINFSINGDFSNFYAQKSIDNKVLDIPFRLLNINSTIYINNNFEIHHTFSSEYIKSSDNFLDSDNFSNDFTREFYGTFYFDKGEISFGKKLFTLGSVDENSPIDHFNPYNYSYLLMGGTDKKVSMESISLDLYLTDFLKINAAFSPRHNMNKFPNSNSDFDLGTPAPPNWWDFFETKGSLHETLLSFQITPNFNSELTFTYLRAFDRVHSLSGFAVFEYTEDYTPKTEPKYSYRLSESINVGGVYLFDDFTIRSDIALFHSFDRNSLNDYQNLLCEQDFLFVQLFGTHNNICSNVFVGDYNLDGNSDEFLLPLNEDAYYYQFAFQLELPLPEDYQINLQYFKYNLYKHATSNYNIPDEIELPMLQVIAGDLFNPGLGSSMGSLTDKSILLSLDKNLLDNNLQLTFTSFFDLDKGNGKLLSFESKYNISDNLDFIFGTTKIIGDSNLINDCAGDLDGDGNEDFCYSFNNMESFSHNRLQLQYFF